MAHIFTLNYNCDGFGILQCPNVIYYFISKTIKLCFGLPRMYEFKIIIRVWNVTLNREVVNKPQYEYTFWVVFESRGVRDAKGVGDSTTIPQRRYFGRVESCAAAKWHRIWRSSVQWNTVTAESGVVNCAQQNCPTIFICLKYKFRRLER